MPAAAAVACWNTTPIIRCVLKVSYMPLAQDKVFKNIYGKPFNPTQTMMTTCSRQLRIRPHPWRCGKTITRASCHNMML
jgi:hypothetical protein